MGLVLNLYRLVSFYNCLIVLITLGERHFYWDYEFTVMISSFCSNDEWIEISLLSFWLKYSLLGGVLSSRD